MVGSARVALVAFGIGVALLASDVSAATRAVPGTYSSIQAAMKAARSGDVVAIEAGEYRENINLKSGVMLQGAGIGQTVINGGAVSSCIYVVGGATAATVIADLTVTNGTSANGGGIKLGEETDCAIRRVEVTRNSATSRGGGIYVSPNSTALIEGCVISENTAKVGAGIYCQTSNCIIRFNLIRANAAAENGGGLYGALDCSEIHNNTFDGNVAPGLGAGASFGSPASTRFEQNIISNSAGGAGLWVSGTRLNSSCNILWGNALGDNSSGALRAAQMVADPLFCNRAARDFSLDAASPGVSASCASGGFIGAFGPACGSFAPTEACCYADGLCSMAIREACIANGGTPMGGGTSCEASACPTSPLPPPPPPPPEPPAPPPPEPPVVPPPPVALGACCVRDLCVDAATETDCNAAGGTWLGDGSSCASGSCANAVEPSSWGEIKARFR